MERAVGGPTDCFVRSDASYRLLTVSSWITRRPEVKLFEAKLTRNALCSDVVLLGSGWWIAKPDIGRNKLLRDYQEVGPSLNVGRLHRLKSNVIIHRVA